MEPSLLALLDQIEATMVSIAPVLGSYRKALVDAGFSPKEAFLLAVAMQEKLFPGYQGKTDGPAK